MKQCLVAALAAVTMGQIAAHATLISVATPGNLLALLPVSDLASSSNNTGFGAALGQITDNFVNTSNQDNGLIFTDTDTDQRVALTGFNSAIRDIRFFTSPSDPIRFPATLTIYSSLTSTTSLTPGNYTVLLPTTVLNPALFTPVANSTAAYIDFLVNAPTGTQSLLLDLGGANGVGDRISELQAFQSTPEPSSLCLMAAAGIAVFTKLRLRKNVHARLD